MTHDYIILLARIETAVRVLIHVQDNKPGDDLGQYATAVAMLELRAAMRALDIYRGEGWKFDAPGALEYLKNARTYTP